MKLRDIIRFRLWDERKLGELARDIQQALDKLRATDVLVFTDTFRKSMVVGKIPEEPIEIRAGRVLIEASPETPTAPGHVHFTYLGADKGARINDIPGLTEGVRYRFTLVVTYA